MPTEAQWIRTRPWRVATMMAGSGTGPGDHTCGLDDDFHNTSNSRGQDHHRVQFFRGSWYLRWIKKASGSFWASPWLWSMFCQKTWHLDPSVLASWQQSIPVLWLFFREHDGEVSMVEQVSPILCTLELPTEWCRTWSRGCWLTASLLLVSDHSYNFFHNRGSSSS